MIQLSLPRWSIPLIVLVILLAIYPQVRKFDKERQLEVAVQDLEQDHKMELATDLRADEVGAVQAKINELLGVDHGTVSLSRSGNVIYQADIEGESYEAMFYITSLNFFIKDYSITGLCNGSDCVTLTKQGTIGSESITISQVSFPLHSKEQGDKLISFFQQYKQMCDDDVIIERGWKRRLKKWVDKIL